MTTERVDDATALTADERRILAAIADRLIPAAHGMPSAADVVTDERLRFVLNARPDLREPLHLALRADLGDDPQARLDALGANEPATLYALQLVIVGAYYTDAGVRDGIGYPGQVAITVRSWEYPPYLEEGLIDAVLARGPVWRDPATGTRAVAANAPMTYAERFAGTPDGGTDAAPPEGGPDGHDRA
jgi:hypothetical protein